METDVEKWSKEESEKVLKEIGIKKGNIILDFGCDAEVCAAVSECPHGILIQDAPWEVPYTLQDFCVGCGRCSIACPFKAIKMI